MTDIASSSTTLEEARPECPYLYQYDSLEDKPSRAIRLLTVGYDGDHGACDPSKRCDDYRDSDRCKHACYQAINPHELKVSLHEACLDDSPQYEAISYAWGSANLVQQVACDSKWLWVTQSCYDLLVILRRYSSGTRYWIDAICINQGFQEEDTREQRSQRERSHQVAMMATIYENAVQVVVWPGHCEIDAVGLRESLYSAFRNAWSGDIPRLRSLIQQPYFTRIWPLQEIALAQSVSDDASQIGVPQAFLANPEFPSLELEYERVTTLHRRLLGYFQSRSHDSNADTTPSRSPSISEVLLHARSHQASEPRDKVFALYGMLWRLQAHLEAPNYLRSVEDIYLEASVAAIRGDQSLRVLEGLTGISSFELPSWSPDWSDHQHITKIAEWTDHKASGSSEAQPCIRERELLIDGLLVDVVYQEYTAFADTSFLVKAETLAERLTEPLCDLSNVSEEQYLDLLEKVFVDVWGDVDERSPRDYVHWKLLQNDAEKRTEKKAVCRLIGYRIDKEYAEGVIKHTPILRANLCRRLDRKKLFQTRNGRFGIASKSIKSGDSIVLLQGCNLPMIVRPEGNKWRLIAPAYLSADGIMDGKLWKPDGPFESFTFT